MCALSVEGYGLECRSSMLAWLCRVTLGKSKLILASPSSLGHYRISHNGGTSWHSSQASPRCPRPSRPCRTFSCDACLTSTRQWGQIHKQGLTLPLGEWT